MYVAVAELSCCVLDFHRSVSAALACNPRQGWRRQHQDMRSPTRLARIRPDPPHIWHGMIRGQVSGGQGCYRLTCGKWNGPPIHPSPFPYMGRLAHECSVSDLKNPTRVLLSRFFVSFSSPPPPLFPPSTDPPALTIDWQNGPESEFITHPGLVAHSRLVPNAWSRSAAE